MWSDLRDAWNWIQGLVRRVERVESGAFLENSSITNGRFRIIGGLLRVDSGGRVEVIGEWRFFGPGAITGDVVAEGKWTQNGAWEFNGRGDIDGDVDITGNLALLGGGKFSSDNVRIEGGKIYAGGMVIDPEEAGGSVVFPDGAKVTGNDGAPGVKLESGAGWTAYVAQNGIRLAGGVGEASLTLTPAMLALGADRVQISASELVLDGGIIASLDDVAYFQARRHDGTAGWLPKSVGGPTGSGLLRWPFALSLVTKEFDTTDPTYSPPGHRGIDFGAGAGTPIPAAGSGTVLAAGFDSERGYFVILDHGTRDGRTITTRYYHLIGPSPLTSGAAISKGDTVGSVGSTGLSDGPHLHFETRYDGVAENPRAVMAIYGE
ncbi:M23 family metallopeptidase [Microbacterium sp. MMO-56]|uniref:M23 family metallopeptidase n=1 Tax=Microbacterium sp. MMO-56 TaxID=3081281 RepID=UPI003019B747